MKALRLYARLGLLAPERIDEANGYRWYRKSQVATARLIGQLRRLDMPLHQVAQVIAAAGPVIDEIERLRQTDEAAATRKAAQLVADYWDAVERRVASQRVLAAHLLVRLSGSEGVGLDAFTIRTRAVPEQTVLTEQRSVLVAELSQWLSETTTRLAHLATARFGGVVEPMFVVYHGEVNNDSDGPVEVCVPVAAPAGSDGLRSEPAHREAYARVTRAQVEFPQILSAYDAVAQWIAANGHSMTGSPREVYFADFAAARPGDEVVDVAFPIR
jgi:DNA-binding transcriptional MerR regulator